ncbi:transcriptional regulator of stress and heat shock response [Staphylococcus auricularis]
MMHNMSDIIEQYIKQLFEDTDDDVVEIQRANIAQRFDCVPSQLNYVIKTRFTNEHGYEIESKRGGGGYIRITKVENKDTNGYINRLLQLIGPSISQQQAYYIIDGLLEKDYITEREAKMIHAIVDRDTLKLDVMSRDIIRANILKKLLPVINYY